MRHRRARRYTPRELARLAGFNVQVVRRHCLEGLIQPTQRTGRKGHYWAIPEDAAQDYLLRVAARPNHWSPVPRSRT